MSANDQPDRDLIGKMDRAWLERELSETHATIRSLIRQLKKEQAAHAEVQRAYNKTVANLVETMRENTQLTMERDRWKARAQGVPLPSGIESLPLALTGEEISAIRKAMARLYHPDTGGDAERMKAWNAVLDRIEQHK